MKKVLIAVAVGAAAFAAVASSQALLFIQNFDAVHYTSEAIKAAPPRWTIQDSPMVYSLLTDPDRGDGIALVGRTIWDGLADVEVLPLYQDSNELPAGARAFAPVIMPDGRVIRLDPKRAKTKVLEYYDLRGELPPEFVDELRSRMME